MKKSSIEIYGLAVCFVTLLCFIIALGVGLYDLLQLAYPEFTLNAHEYERHRSNDSFRNSPRSVSYVQWSTPPVHGTGPDDGKTYKVTHRGVPTVPQGGPEITEDETTRRRKESYRSVLRAERRNARQSLALVGIVMLIDVLVFLPHWILARRLRVSRYDGRRVP